MVSAMEKRIVRVIVFFLVIGAFIALAYGGPHRLVDMEMGNAEEGGGGRGSNGASKSNLTYYSCQEGNQLTEGNRRIFRQHGIRLSSEAAEADIYIPCGYTSAQLEIDGMKPAVSEKAVIYAVPGMDNIVAKNGIWELLVAKHGRDQASRMMPMSYVLYNFNDGQAFLREAKNADVYILKKNIQRQEGLKLVTKADIPNQAALEEYRKQGYVLIQKFIDNPYCIRGHKINLRIYLLYVCDSSGKSAYMYNDGFVYYTPKPYKYGTEPDEVITTGYNRELYKTCPLTHQDLRRHLGMLKSKWLFHSIRTNMRQTLDAVSTKICRPPKGKANFQLFGCDYQINAGLSVYLLEFNKGPSLSEFDARDASLKHRVQEDAFKLMGLLNGPGGESSSSSSNGFERIWTNK